MQPTTPLEPVAERIVVQICERLATISTDNGYPFNASVARFENRGNPKGAANATVTLLVHEEPPSEAFDIAPAGSDGFRMRVNVACVAFNNRAVTLESSGTVMNRVTALVRKCIAEDYHLGGLALNTFFAPSTFGGGVGDSPAVIVPIDVSFWTRRNDPYTPRSFYT